MHLITLRHTTLDGTPPNEESARRRELYPTKHSTHNRQDTHAPGRIRTRNPGKRAATGTLLFLSRGCFTKMSTAQTRQNRVVG
jgi:hypothetical protein